MKSVKMSLVAVLLLGANVYAADNVKVGGDAKLFYGTQGETLNGAAEKDIFNKSASYADFGFTLGVTADLMENVKAGGKVQIVSTLGLEHEIATAPWSSAHSSSSGVLNTTEWVSEGWLEGKLGNTTGKIGRMTLDTPLAFTETWSVDYNTFEAVVVSNEDIPDTTLSGMFIAQSNGYADDLPSPAAGSITSTGGAFNTFGSGGAYVIGATNNSIKPLTAQAWYYDLPNTADAVWLQADLDYDGILAGAQYVNIDRTSATDNDIAYALKLGYAIPDVVTVTAAYSSVDDKSPTGVANMATEGQNAGAASSLYTEYWWWFATASAPGSDTMMLSAESTVYDVDLFLGLYSSDIQPSGASKQEVDEITFTASKSCGPVDTSLALIYDMFDQDAPKPTTYMKDLSTVQVYLTYNY